MVVWTSILAIEAFSILAWPFAAIPSWHRWLFMLVFPLLAFATQGLLRMDRRIRIGFLAIVVVLAIAFVSLPPQDAFPYYTSSRTILYLQTSMLQNTVPLSDSPDIEVVIEWLNGMHFTGSVLVAHTSFVGWANLYLREMEAYGFGEASQVNEGDFSRYAHVFLVYWVRGEGWFNPALLPQGMSEIHRTGRIGVYELS